MKSIKRLLAAVLVLTLMASMFIVAEASGTCYTTGRVNLRKSVGLNSSSVVVVPQGTQLEWSTTKRDDRNVLWVKTSYKGHTGWISTIYLTKKKGGHASQGTITMTGNGYIHKTPNKNANTLGVLSKGKKAEWYDTAKDSRGVKWYLVYVDGIVGWVSSANTKDGGGSKPTKSVVGKSGTSYIRSQPNLSGKALITLHAGESARYEGKKQYDDRGVAWYKVTFNGTTGWVSSKYTVLK